MKKILRAIILPPLWFRWTFGLVSLIAVGCVFLFQIQNAPIAYAAFLASALGLYYLITVTLLPLIRKIKALMMQNSLLRRYYEDRDFNARVILYRGLIINIVYAVFKLITGLYYGSEWLIAIAVYYGFLIVLKTTLVRHDLRSLRQKTESDEWKKWRSYRRVGWLMLLLNVGLSGIVVQVVAQDKSYSYPGTIIFAMAAYSFYRIIIAVTRLLKNRESRDPLFSAAKMIDFSFAVTSMFTLQTAMFASFAKRLDVRGPNIITGTAVAVIVTALAVTMIVRASQKMKTLK